MKEVAHFYIISFEEFKKLFEYENSFTSSKTIWTEEEILEIYNSISIPEKKGPCYIFKNPLGFNLYEGKKKVIPLGIKVDIIEEEYILSISRYTKSIEDYKNIQISAYTPVPFFTSNYERNLFLWISNNSHNKYRFEKDEKIAAGIFIPTGIAF